jgi:hypothetical protein
MVSLRRPLECGGEAKWRILTRRRVERALAVDESRMERNRILKLKYPEFRFDSIMIEDEMRVESAAAAQQGQKTQRAEQGCGGFGDGGNHDVIQVRG